MATAEANFDLYLCAQRGQFLDEYYKFFAPMVETINANGGRTGLHSTMFKRHFVSMREKRAKKRGKKLKDLLATELTGIEEKATKGAKEAATGEYLTSLVLLLAGNERYGLLKTQLDNNFLMGKHQCSWDVLPAKRLLTDFIPATGAPKRQIEPTEPMDVALVKTKNRGEIQRYLLLP
jgi:hypothetical protein